MKKKFLFILINIFPVSLFAQKYHIEVLPDALHQKVIINAGGKPFAGFIYPDSLEKPVVYPVYAANGEIITRGFPIEPRANEPVDHPHHVGLWLNYENVNGLDFWNNSYAIPSEKKNKYGWIKSIHIAETESGSKGILKYTANWQDIHKNILLKEATTLIFSADGGKRIIDRITTLTATQDVSFPDTKDGMLGMRVTHELELPSKEERQFTDLNGNITTVAANNNPGVTGNYLTSEEREGDSAWGTRAKWCMLYGKKGKDTISIAIIDHPQNVGYPTYWHARGYGLFAANPLGQKIFSNGKQTLNFNLQKGNSVTFRFRVVINSGNERLTSDEINVLSNEFAQIY